MTAPTRIVDAHVHLWDPARTDWYPYLSGRQQLDMGDVDELLDVPPGGLGPVGREVEAAGHPAHVAHVQLLTPGQVGVPVGAGRVPEVHVGVHDAGRGGHRASTISRRASSNHSGRDEPVGELTAHLLCSPSSPDLSGAELVVARGWCGLRSHPRPSGSISFGGPSLPEWFDDALREIVEAR